MFESRLMLSPEGDVGGGGEGGGAAAASIADFSEDSTADWSGDGNITSFKDFRQTFVPKSEFSKSQADLKARTTTEATQAAHAALNQRFQTDPNFRTQLLAELRRMDPPKQQQQQGAVSDVAKLLDEARNGPNQGWMNADSIEKIAEAMQAQSTQANNSLRQQVAGALQSVLQQRQQDQSSVAAASQQQRRQQIIQAAQDKHSEFFSGDDGLAQLTSLFHGMDGSDDLDKFEPAFMEGVDSQVKFFTGRAGSAAKQKAEESRGRVFAATGGDATPAARPPGGKPPDKRQVAQEMAQAIAARNRMA